MTRHQIVVWVHRMVMEPWAPEAHTPYKLMEFLERRIRDQMNAISQDHGSKSIPSFNGKAPRRMGCLLNPTIRPTPQMTRLRKTHKVDQGASVCHLPVGKPNRGQDSPRFLFSKAAAKGLFVKVLFCFCLFSCPLSSFFRSFRSSPFETTEA